MNKFKSTRLLIILFMSVAICLGAASIPNDTVIAKFGGQQLTFENLNNRINKIPAMYRQKYSTPEGKIKLLDMLVTEELFYLEALELKIDQDTKMLERVENQKSNYLSQEFRKRIGKDFEVDESVLREYYNNNQPEFPGLTFEEAKSRVNAKIYAEKQKEYIDNFIENKKAEYELKINFAIVDSLDLETLELPEEFADADLFTTNNEQIKMTAKDFVKYLQTLKDDNRFRSRDNKELSNFVEKLAENRLLYHLALESGMDKEEAIAKEIDQIKRNLILRTIYNQEIVEKIDLSDEAAKKYYDEHIDEFSSKATRKIQQFVYSDEKKAKENYKKVKKLMKKGNDEEIDKIVEETTIKPGKKGVLSYIYKNDIIPGLGKDKIYSAKVWKQNPKKLSKVFQDSKGNYVFFRILEDNPSKAEVFEDIITKVKSKMRKNLSKEMFEDMNKRLAEKYNVEKFPDRLIVKLEPKEYFDNAEVAQKGKRYDDAIYYYDQIVKLYPDTNDAYKALFMKAFLLSEELNKKDEAVEIFQQVLDYPEGELHDSAKFMIDELTGKETSIKFED